MTQRTQKRALHKKRRLFYLPPPPFMIFSSKLEICQRNSDKSSDNNKDDEDYKQDAVDSVYPMTPDTGKYIVEFDIYSTEGQKSSHCHLWKSTPVPRK